MTGPATAAPIRAARLVTVAGQVIALADTRLAKVDGRVVYHPAAGGIATIDRAEFDRIETN